MNIPTHKFLIVSILACCFITACSSSPKQTEHIKYNAFSWRSYIPNSCMNYYDGCNDCRRTSKGAVAACTRKSCYKYQKPRCLD